MNRRLPNIINSLMDNIVNCEEEDLREDLDSSFDTVILSIDEFDGLNVVMNVILQLLRHEDHRKRAATGYHLAKFFAAADVDYSRYNQDIIRALLISFDDRDKEVVKSSWSALSEFTKKLKKEEMENLVASTRQTLLQVGVAGHSLAGFELPKGINAILPIFLQGLDERNSRAEGLCGSRDLGPNRQDQRGRPQAFRDPDHGSANSCGLGAFYRCQIRDPPHP